MKLDRALNIVVPVERSDGTTIYVHSTPISREVFDQFFLVIAKTFSAIHTQGLGHVAGPRIAAKLLKKIAEDLGPQQLEQVQTGLLAEMRRLSNVIVANGAGWAPMPIDRAIAAGILEAEDADEVENVIAFFMLVSAMHKKKDAREILAGAAMLWSAQLTSSNSTAFTGSLSTSTPAVSTGEKLPPSSIPS